VPKTEKQNTARPMSVKLETKTYLVSTDKIYLGTSLYKHDTCSVYLFFHFSTAGSANLH
jgi:hypothetical protein